VQLLVKEPSPPIFNQQQRPTMRTIRGDVIRDFEVGKEKILVANRTLPTQPQRIGLDAHFLSPSVFSLYPVYLHRQTLFQRFYRKFFTPACLPRLPSSS
jgi:hypothetical protein